MSASKSARTHSKGTRASPSKPSRTEEMATLQVDVEPSPDMPFADGVDDILGTDLRHRLVSEAAYHHLAERGFAEGSEIDDWTAAEGEIDHTLADRPSHRR